MPPRKKATSETPPATPIPSKKGEETVKKPAAGGLMASLMGKAKAAPEKVVKKKTKPIMTLEGVEAEVLDTFASADAIVKVAKSNQEAAKAKAAEIIKAKYLRMCIEGGYKPENPAVNTANSTVNFQVKHVSKVKTTAPPNGGVPLTIEQQLGHMGFSQDVIDTITSKVIKEKPHLGLKKFTDLQGDESTPAQRAVADKIMLLIQDNLNDEELALCLEQSIETTVDEGWKDLAVKTACDIGGDDVDAGIEALSKLYAVLPPQFVMAQIIFKGELQSAFGKLQTVPTERKVIESGTGKYIAVCEGTECTLYMVKPDGNEKIGDKNVERKGTKKCSSANHAEMSARKWFREPDALGEALGEFASAHK